MKQYLCVAIPLDSMLSLINGEKIVQFIGAMPKGEYRKNLEQLSFQQTKFSDYL